ncbi:MAG TPA: argininosuccinate synthase [Fibrobacteria bacterium]|nr:argininosuccinate synthase [Fibrobacteria bacterium]
MATKKKARKSPTSTDKHGKQKVVLAYSGGLDTSVIIPWLKENYDYDVIAFAADVGQGVIETDGLIEKAKKTGASKCYVLDLRKEFLEEYVWPTLKAGARYEGMYLLGTSMARPLIAKHQVLIAEKEGAVAVSHGATGKGNDQVRFELTYLAMNPRLKIIAPWKDPKWTIRSREDAIEYGQARGVPLTVSKKKIYSQDGNLWHLSHEGGMLEHPDQEHPWDMLRNTVTPEKAPSRPGYVTIEFQKGIPVGLDGKRLGAVELMEALNELGGKHGCGIVDMVENRLVGMKSRGVYETPGGALLYRAHEFLEQLVLDRDTLGYKLGVGQKYAQLVYDGMWFAPLRQALDAFVDKTQEVVTGQVTLKLYKGNIMLHKMQSPYSLYDAGLGGFSDVETYNQQDAKGFIKCLGLSLQTRALVLGKKSNVKI